MMMERCRITRESRGECFVCRLCSNVYLMFICIEVFFRAEIDLIVRLLMFESKLR